MTTTKQPKIFRREYCKRSIPVFEECLSHLAGKANIRALEIGSFEGRSAHWLLEHILTQPDARLDCIDLWDGNPDKRLSGDNKTIACVPDCREMFTKNIEEDPDYGHKVKAYEGLSSEIMPWMIDESFEYDIVFIDGSHRADEKLCDMVMSWHLLKKGGILIADDYDRKNGESREELIPATEPYFAINSFLKCHKGQYTELHRDYVIAIKKEI